MQVSWDRHFMLSGNQSRNGVVSNHYTSLTLSTGQFLVGPSAMIHQYQFKTQLCPHPKSHMAVDLAESITPHYW